MLILIQKMKNKGKEKDTYPYYTFTILEDYSSTHIDKKSRKEIIDKVSKNVPSQITVNIYDIGYYRELPKKAGGVHKNKFIIQYDKEHFTVKGNYLKFKKIKENLEKRLVIKGFLR